MTTLTCRASWNMYELTLDSHMLGQYPGRPEMGPCVLLVLGVSVRFLYVCRHHQVEGVLTDTKNQLSSEILRRVEMENQVQTLREQLDLQRNISEQVTHVQPILCLSPSAILRHLELFISVL